MVQTPASKKYITCSINRHYFFEINLINTLYSHDASHIQGYAAYIQLFVDSLAGEKYEVILTQLEGLWQGLLPNKYVPFSPPATLSPQARKEVLKILQTQNSTKNATGESDVDLEILKSELKFGRLCKQAAIIEQLLNDLLENLSNLFQPSVRTWTFNPHNSDVQNTMFILRALNAGYLMLNRIPITDNAPNALVCAFKKCYFKKESPLAKGFQLIVKDPCKFKSLSDELATLQTRKEIRTWLKAVGFYDQNIGELYYNLLQFHYDKSDGCSDATETLNNLFNIIARHTILLVSSFVEIYHRFKDVFAAILKLFMKRVLEQSGWKNLNVTSALLGSELQIRTLYLDSLSTVATPSPSSPPLVPSTTSQ